MSLNEEGLIDPDKLPKKYRKILKSAGIKKKFLKDKEKVPMIMDTLNTELKKQGEEEV